MTSDLRLIEVKIAPNQIGFEEFPALAGDALEADFDGPAFRRMAALVQPTAFETDELLLRFMLELGFVAIFTPLLASGFDQTCRPDSRSQSRSSPVCLP